jgi:hypothetical protein
VVERPVRDLLWSVGLLPYAVLDRIEDREGVLAGLQLDRAVIQRLGVADLSYVGYRS